MTAALRNSPPNPSDDSVSSATSTPCNTPVARQQSISVNPDRVVGAPLNVPLPSSFVPGWNSQGRLATETPAEKRISQGLPLKTNLASEFSPPSKRGGRKCRYTLPSLCLHVSCPQSYCLTRHLKCPYHRYMLADVARHAERILTVKTISLTMYISTTAHNNRTHQPHLYYNANTM